ncbi:MAG: hypothetical protein SGCHY_005228, partial [Lobulomycetales sp.]
MKQGLSLPTSKKRHSYRGEIISPLEPVKLLAWNLACRVAEESSLMDAAKDSFLCRSSKGKRADNYTNFKDDIVRVLSGNFYRKFEKLSVIGVLEEELLKVGELVLSLDLGAVKGRLNEAGLEIKDFIHANRSHDKPSRVQMMLTMLVLR